MTAHQTPNPIHTPPSQGRRIAFALTLAAAIASLACYLHQSKTDLTLSELSWSVRLPVVENAAAKPLNPEQHSGIRRSKDEPADLLRRKIADGASTDDLLRTLRSLAEQDPHLALQLAQGIARDGNEKFTLVEGVVDAWATHDPGEAWDWAMTAQPGENLPGINMYFDRIVEHMAISNPVELISRVEDALQTGGWPPGLEDELHLAAMTESAFEALCQSGNVNEAKAAVEKWAQFLPEERRNSLPLKAVAESLAESSPADAATWLQKLPVSGRLDIAFEAVGSQWLKRDSTAAMNWVISLEGEAGTAAARNTYDEWLQADQPGAVKWLSDRLSSAAGNANAATDYFIASVVRETNIKYAEPTAAIVWAEAVSDPRLRLQSIERVIQAWNRTNPVAAKQYLANTTSLEPDQKAALLDNIQKNPLDDDF